MDYFDRTYYDPDYFDTDDAAGGVLIPGMKHRVRMKVEAPAVIEEVTDDGWITILL